MGATYQNLVDHIFKNLIEITMGVYINDIIVKSKYKEDYLMYLQEVFDRLNQFKLKLNAIKCIFGITLAKIPWPYDHNPQSKSRPS